MAHALSTLYGAAAAWRRRWYSDHPDRRRKLDRPVISVGNLRVGGSGKTPVVEHIARLLVESGYVPAILSRGYGRRSPSKSPTIVSDGREILARVDEAGDEPLMLAKALLGKGVSVVVCADRYAAGRLAESRLGATVHVLDDGFQHFGLARDVDLLVSGEHDLADEPLPYGRLREALSAAVSADALLVDAGYQDAAERVARVLRVRNAYHVTRTLLPPRIVGSGDTVVVPNDSRVFAFAGIARPERFFSDLTSAGWKVVGTKSFRDHHYFSVTEIARIAAAAKKARAAIVLTTDKDAVRLPPDAAEIVADGRLASVPLVSTVEPAHEFRAWLLGQIR
ncbi:MAG TPA: tetraacyldisaccharide 4'-kinase [Vicinamibacterales bacterium]|nr:tetraacyldisaccharide 4'-kinase [Vicinamibacterales bacterium]